MADSEWSLFHDIPPMLSINTLKEPMPSSDKLWAAGTATEWMQIMRETEGACSTSPMSLRDLYRIFMDGEALKSRRGLSPTHLRLLLAPLQALVCHLRQCLQCIDSYRTHRKGSMALSETATQAQLHQVHMILQQWYTLSSRCSPAETTCSPVFFSSLVLYHLIALNTMIGFTCIEEVAARGPPQGYQQCKRSSLMAEWQSICSLEDSEEIFFHCGQLLRLYCIMPQAVQPIWWPAVLYRVAIIAWFNSLSNSVPHESSQALQPNPHSIYQVLHPDFTGTKKTTNTKQGTPQQFSIDALPPDDPTLVHYVRFREGEPMFTRP